jgi:[ribosomal protein S5]-alanine N-acetyltransferase
MRLCFKESPPKLTAQRIVGERVVLCPIDTSYSAAIFREFTAEITRYMLPSPPETMADTLAFIAQARIGMRERRELVVAITERYSGEFLGCCGIHTRTLNPRTPELGIWLKKSAHGNRYGREAIARLVAWANEFLDVEYLIYPVDRANIASRKIPEALGGVIFEEKQVTTMAGTVLDEVIYRIAAQP